MKKKSGTGSGSTFPGSGSGSTFPGSGSANPDLDPYQNEVDKNLVNRLNRLRPKIRKKKNVLIFNYILYKPQFTNYQHYLIFVWVGMVKQPTEHTSEFQMSNEDFPALPGAPPR